MKNEDKPITTRDVRSSAPKLDPMLAEAREALEKEVRDAEHALGHSTDLAAGIENEKRLVRAKEALEHFDHTNAVPKAPPVPTGNKLAQNKLTIPNTIVRFASLGLEALLTKEDRARLIKEEAEYCRLQEIITECAHTTVQQRLSQQRSDLMTAAGPLSQKELESFTHSAEETKRIAAERNKIAYARAERHTREVVQPICNLIYRRLLPKIEEHIARAEATERDLHSRFGISVESLPVTNTLRQAFENIRSHLEESEKWPAHSPYGPRDKLSLLLDWSRIEAPLQK